MLLTAWTNLETAVELVKAGAADYLAKPWDNARLVTTVRNLLQLHAALTRGARAAGARRPLARASCAAQFDLRGIVYRSAAMHAVVQMATQVARADVPVLITGPNGAGKEIIAEIIQANSAVRDGPFVRVNVGALPCRAARERVVRCRGRRVHRREAACGALRGGERRHAVPRRDRQPLDGRARRSCCACCRPASSSGWVRARRGASRSASSPRPIRRCVEAIRQGRFREDLYYRLNVIELQVPPLAERRDDILPLAQHFLEPGYEFTARGRARAAASRLAGQRARAARTRSVAPACSRRRRASTRRT